MFVRVHVFVCCNNRRSSWSSSHYSSLFHLALRYRNPQGNHRISNNHFVIVFISSPNYSKYSKAVLFLFKGIELVLHTCKFQVLGAGKSKEAARAMLDAAKLPSPWFQGTSSISAYSAVEFRRTWQCNSSAVCISEIGADFLQESFHLLVELQYKLYKCDH